MCKFHTFNHPNTVYTYRHFGSCIRSITDMDSVFRRKWGKVRKSKKDRGE